MTATNDNPYLKTKVMTASPTELRLMLLDGAVKFLQQGAKGLADGDHEAAYNGITRCQDIVLELMNALNPDVDPGLCDRLSSLYTFMYTELVKACSEHNQEKADGVLKLLEYERETWRQLMEKLAAENATGAATADAMAEAIDGATFDLSAGDGVIPDQLIGGRVSLEG